MSDSPEQAVERYFDYLSDPTTLVDQGRVDDLNSQIENASTLIERAKLISERERAESVDASEVVQGFITNGRRWAKANNISASALRAVGVPADVISSAGIDGGSRRGRSSVGRSSRGRGVGTAAVIENLLGREGEYTYQQVMSDTGSSLMTVRKAVESLIEDGRVQLVRQDPEWNRPGRAPNLYRTV